jgi:tyramine---L-glutamate ligase
LNLLVFEFATAMGLQNPSITMEGQAMLAGLLADLREIELEYPISKYSSIDLSEISNVKTKSKPLVINDDLSSWLDENIGNYDTCFPVAPEENLILYELTKKIEDNKLKNIGSSSEAVFNCSDKFKTYNLLKNDFPYVKTEKIFFKDLKKYKKVFNGNNGKMVVKPADGVSCSGVQMVYSYADFIEASIALKSVTSLPYFLLQEYVEGISASVSILSNGVNATSLSLNLQDIRFKQDRLHYIGGEVPFEHELSGKANEIAEESVESIKGLRGYVGVDLVLDESNDEIYLLEINPRLTTSYIALRKLLNFNLGLAILKAVNGKLPSDIKINGSLSFVKEDEIIFNR